MFCPTNFHFLSGETTVKAEIRLGFRAKAWFLILENNLLYFPIMELHVNLWRIVPHRRNPLRKASFVQKFRSHGTGH